MPKSATSTKTIEQMVRIYCAGKHKTDLCSDCSDLLAYARERLANCPFGDNKPVCGRCTENCFEPARRAQMQAVMRYAGMRMMIHHPLSATRHLIQALMR
jgi:predicted amidophosphoribosyltransferase